ncbi:uroporphyrinogen-III C-methyltransferase [Gammaproteobacteria bacterium 53_120_T64]|nr:uroporphyrinogen-III C-methyltransferase [Gammaproteobacteria bacterium 53_120_T64]
MDYLPLFHRVAARPCLVVGGGEVALRKVRTLCEAGAHISVIAPAICQGLVDMAQEYAALLNLYQREYHRSDLDDVVLVIAATNDQPLNAAISTAAQGRNIPVNVVDNPALCSVIFPAIIDRSPIQVAITSSGTSPVMTRLLRGRIEALLPGNLGALAKLAARYRGKVKALLSGENQRRHFWETVLDGAVAESVYTGNEAKADQQLLAQLEAMVDEEAAGAQPKGEVYLVGAGPGDPDLLTFRALRLMQRADVVLHDRLVSPQVLAMVRRDAERIYVGKRAGDHAVSQKNINSLLVDLAKEGKRVLRLKGGDPFIFGRGGEEIERLAEEGVSFQVVPGITAASGCASYAGIPLTHRDFSQSVQFITGHKQDFKLDLNWSSLAVPNQTLVFYMSLVSLGDICSELVKHGLASDTPAALVEKGTTPQQRVVIGDLENLADKVAGLKVRAPTLLIIGHVVSLQNKLAWFNTEKNQEIEQGV